MPKRSISLFALCSLLAASALACGKSEEPPAAPASDEVEAPLVAAEPEPAADEGEGGASDASDEASKEDAAAGKDDAVRKPRLGPRDRLANRRPPPRDNPRMGRGGDTAKGIADPRAAAGTDEATAEEEPTAEAPTDPDAKLEDAAPTDDKTKPTLEAKEGEPSPSAAPPGPAGSEARDPSAPEDPKLTPAELRPSAPPIRPADVQRAAPPPPSAPTKAPEPGLDPARLLPLASVLETTQGKGLVDAGVLPGIATGGGYSSIHYRGAATDKFGVSLQVWQDPARREADDRFRRMRLQYPNAEDVQVLPAKAFFARFGGIQMLTFVDSVKRVVVTIGCNESLCSHDQLTKLAKIVRERL